MRLRALTLTLFLTSLIASASATMTTIFNPADSVIVNSTYVISNAAGTPYNIWIAAIVAAILLIIIACFSFPYGAEGMISVMAWFPAGFAFATAFNVDQITVAGVTAMTGSYTIVEKHTLYHFDLIAYTCLLPLLVCAILNTARIWLNMRALRQIAAPEETEQGEDLT